MLVVVMTTRVVERGRTKCGQYWPAEEGESATHGDFQITTQSVQQLGDYTLSQLILTNSKVSIIGRVKLKLKISIWYKY